MINITISATLTFISVGLIWKATKILKFSTNLSKLYEEAHRLYRQRYVVGVDQARLGLADLIKKNTKQVYRAGLLVLLAYLVMFYNCFFIIKGLNPSPFWQVALFVLVMFSYPIIFLFLAPFFEIKRMNIYVEERFSGELDINKSE